MQAPVTQAEGTHRQQTSPDAPIQLVVRELVRMADVQGAAHFDVPETAGVALIGELRRRLPGYLVPRFVREIAGENAKSPAFAT